MNRTGIAIECLLLFGAIFSTLTASASAQCGGDSLLGGVILFRRQSAQIDTIYKQNGPALDALHRLLTDTTLLATLDSVGIRASASPDGNWSYNRQLAHQRAAALKGYIETRYTAIAPAKIHTQGVVRGWSSLRPTLAKHHSLYRASILAVLDRQLSAQATELQLRQLDSGKAWRYIRTLLPALRVDSVWISTHPKAIAPPTPPQKIEPQTAEESVMVESIVLLGAAPERIRHPLFAIKSNLLFDALTALNVELEFPIGQRWSIAAEYLFPWWLSCHSQRGLQSLSGNLEGRYWFGDRTVHRVLTGWFAGFYGGGGYYDAEWNHRGYQGWFFIPAGVSGGYAHTIGRNLSMEYSIGVGYMQTDYRKYEARLCPSGKRRLIEQASGTYRWFGPTRVKVSLVWLINGGVGR